MYLPRYHIFFIHSIPSSFCTPFSSLLPSLLFSFRSFSFTVLAANDPNHVQLGLNIVDKPTGVIPNVQLWLTGSPNFAPVTNLNSFSGCWTHITVTFNLTGMHYITRIFHSDILGMISLTIADV